MKNDNDALTLIKVCGSTEAEMLREVLANNGIECDLQGDAASHMIPATGDLDEVRIWVRAEDASRAREFADDFSQPADENESHL